MHALSAALFGCAVIAYVEAKFVIEVQQNLRPCQADHDFPLDFSDMEVIPDEEEQISLNGKVTIKRELKGPVGVNFYTKRLEQGDWVDGAVARRVLDICPLLQSPAEPWFGVMSQLKKKGCPYPEGHVESFNMLEIGNMGFEIPPSFAGDWQFFAEVMSDGTTSCLKVDFSILEV